MRTDDLADDELCYLWWDGEKQHRMVFKYPNDSRLGPWIDVGVRATCCSDELTSVIDWINDEGGEYGITCPSCGRKDTIALPERHWDVRAATTAVEMPYPGWQGPPRYFVIVRAYDKSHDSPLLIHISLESREP